MRLSFEHNSSMILNKDAQAKVIRGHINSSLGKDYFKGASSILTQDVGSIKYSDTDYEALIKVTPEAPIVKMIDHLGIADSHKRVYTLTRQVLQACNVIRPKLGDLKQNPQKSIDAGNLSKFLKSLKPSNKAEIGI